MVSKSLAKLLFLSGTILSLALPINVSAEESSVYSSSVNVTVPVTVNAVFNEDGTTDVSALNINNSSLVPITVYSVDVYGTNGWSLVSESEKIKVDNKKINLKITYKDMLIGNNTISHNVAKQYTSSVPISIKRGAWTKSVTESAFNLSFNYNIGQSDFKLSFNSNGGSSVNSVTIKNGETITLPSPTRTGYTFAGWKSSTGVIYNGGSVYTMLIGDQTLTAQWKANTNTKYVVNHYQMNLDGSTYALKETENKTGTSDSTLTTANLKKTYTGFTYENSKVGSSVVTSTTVSPDGSRVIDLYYSRNQYYIDVNGLIDGVGNGSLSNADGVNFGNVNVYVNDVKVSSGVGDHYKKAYYGSTYKIEVNYVFPGRQYDGVDTSRSPLEGIVTGTVNARLIFSTTKYSVTYKLNGGTNPSSGVTSSYTVDSNAFTLPTPSRTGYTFGGWYDNSSLTGTAITSVPKGSTGNKTYYAKWNLITYNITYNLNGGSATNPSTYNVESTTFSLNNPSKTGYTFSGWTGSNGTTPSKSVSISKGSTGNKSYTANWTANKYSVVFNSNGGSGTMSNQTHTYGSSLALTSNSFTRTGYTFAGWNTKADGTGTNYTNGQSVSNLVSSSGGSITLYAKWTLNTYSITYNLNGGSNPSTGVTTSYNVTSSTITLPTPTRTGYTFGGWFTSSGLSGTAVTTIASGSTGNKVYYAKWNLVNYTISYNLAGGSLANANPSSYNVETATFSLNTPTKLGYAFAGWTGTGLSSATTSVSIAKGSTGNRSYTATWTPNKYTLTFNANGGSVSEATRTVAFGSAYGTLPTPKRTGYTFKGWFTSASGGTQVSSSTIMTSANGATIYAQWTVNNYTLTFNANGGSVSESSRSLAYGTSYGTLPTPSRTGYTFKGWFTASSGGTQVTTTTTMGASNTTVYAQWTAINYKITYNLNGGTNASGAATSFNITSSAITLPTPTRTGYTFGGWYANSSFSGSAVTTIPTGSTGNKTYYAKWNLVTYTISYSLDGGTISGNPTSYNVTTSTFTLPTPTKTGYTFLGWTGSNGTTASTSVSISQGSTGNKSYTANWKINSYKLTYNANGGSVSTASKSLTYGSAYGTLPTPTRSGYKFNGWYTAASGGTKVSDTTTIGASNVTIYAQWSLVTYTITYNLNGGTNSSSNPISYNVTSSAITLANPTRTGYTFGGWYTESSFTNKVTSIATGSTGNKSFYAKWTANTYTVSYDANGGSGTTASSSHTYGTAKTLTSNGFSRTGYTFLGWSTSSTATSATYTNAQSVTNLSSTNGATVKLYAVWKANTYTYNISYVSSSGKSLGTSTVAGTFGTSTTVSAPAKTGYTTPSSQSVTFDSTTPKTIKFTYPLVSYTIGYTLNGGSASNPTSYNIESSSITLNAPTRKGYTFTGWTGSNGTTASTSVSIASGSTGNKTYTANWKANSYTIKFNSNGGSGTMSNLSMTYGTAKALTSNSFTRTGYTFAGWATSSSGSVAYSNGASVNNLTATNGGTVNLYAVWKANTYNLNFDLNSGSSGFGAPKSSESTFNTLIYSSTDGSKRILASDSFSVGSLNYETMFFTFDNNLKNGDYTIVLTKLVDIDHITFYYGMILGSPVVCDVTETDTTITIKLNFNKDDFGEDTDTFGLGFDFTISSQISPGEPVFDVEFYGPENIPSRVIASGSAYGDLPTPTRDGYTFLGWYTAATGGTQVTSTSTMGASDMTIYAQWKANTYTIKFNSNGGSGSMSNLSMTYGTATALTSNKFSRTGYTFAGWSTSSTASTATYTNGQSVSNLTSTAGGTVNLYAVWKANTYTIKFNANGGSGTMPNLSMTYGTAKNLTTNAFTRPGYTFLGWSTSSTAYSPSYSDGASVNNLTSTNGGSVTLYAVWEALKYKVTFDLNGGFVYNKTMSPSKFEYSGMYGGYIDFTDSVRGLMNISSVYDGSSTFDIFLQVPVGLVKNGHYKFSYTHLSQDVNLTSVSVYTDDGSGSYSYYKSATSEGDGVYSFDYSGDETYFYYMICLSFNNSSGSSYIAGLGVPYYYFEDDSDIIKTVLHGSTISSYSFPDAERNGYTLTGWNTKADGSGTQVTSTSIITSNTTLYAQWKATSTLSVDSKNSDEIVSENNLESDVVTNSQSEDSSVGLVNVPVIKEDDKKEDVQVDDSKNSEGGDPPEKDDSILDQVTIDEQVMTDGIVTITDEVESNVDYTQQNYSELFGNSDKVEFDYYKEDVESDLVTKDEFIDPNVVGDDISDLAPTPNNEDSNTTDSMTTYGLSNESDLD